MVDDNNNTNTAKENPQPNHPLPLPPALHIHPPLFNSANPWATTQEQLRALYRCAATGAVTTRTALLDGFEHDGRVHRYAIFEVGGTGDGMDMRVVRCGDSGNGDGERKVDGSRGNASLNTLGYSPLPLGRYLEFIQAIVGEDEKKMTSKSSEAPVSEGEMDNGNGKGNNNNEGWSPNRRSELRGERRSKKPFIVSVTGTPDEVAECYSRISKCARDIEHPLAMEVNLSCPNIPGKPPPAYDGEALGVYVTRVAEEVIRESVRHGNDAQEERKAERDEDGDEEEGKGKGTDWAVPWGVKTPPYTHAGQFEMFVDTLRQCAVVSPGYEEGNRDEKNQILSLTCPLSFVTATNTLGSCLLLGRSDTTEESHDLQDTLCPVLPGSGIGGLAGAPLHPLALGNVATLRRMLDADPTTKHIVLLGIGGVADAEGYRRMRSVGATAVGVGTALGIRGVEVFREIEEGMGGKW
ncbi:FMN-linked oxidoreductase [Astrocystis sublimbata]|nr:FMN-linked oxidoreductase [Astrocystis sublimbata]